MFQFDNFYFIIIFLELQDDGRDDGTSDGSDDGISDGRDDGTADGRDDGNTDGVSDGRDDGRHDGITEGVLVGAKVDLQRWTMVSHLSPKFELQPLSSEQGLSTAPVVQILRTESVGAEPEQKAARISSRLTSTDEYNNRPGPITGEVVGVFPLMFAGSQSEALVHPQVFVLRHNPEAQCELSAAVQEPP